MANWLATGQNGATQGKVLADIAGSTEALEKIACLVGVPTTPAEEVENLGFIPALIYRWKRRRLLSVKTGRYVSLLTKHAKYPLTCRPGTSDDDVFRQIFIRREYRCLDDVREAQLIVDCGANTGLSSAYFLSRFPRAYVVAIEPDPGNFGLLKKNLARYKGRYTAICSAIWSHATGLVFSEIRFCDGREWARVVREAGAGEKPTITSTDIGTILRDSRFERISILKIDIELSEAAVFSANYENWLGKVDNLVIELHDDSCRAAFQKAISAENFTLSQCEELVVCKRKTNLHRVAADRDVALGRSP
jgi:FkbM family methyltransferase